MSRKRIDMSRMRKTTESIGKVLSGEAWIGDGDIIYPEMDKIVLNPLSMRSLSIGLDDVRSFSRLIRMSPEEEGFFDKAYEMAENHSDYNDLQKAHMMAIVELAHSIARSSLIQPVVVRTRDYGQYMLVVGERRFLAHVLLRRDVIRAVLRPVAEGSLDEQIIILSENFNRVDLTLAETLQGIESLMQSWMEANPDASFTSSVLASIIHRSPQHCRHLLNLLKAPPEVRERIDRNELRSIRSAIAAISSLESNTSTR